MAKYAVVKSGVVESMVVWDGVTEFSVAGSELIEATASARVGATWNGSVFTFVEPTPAALTAEQTAAGDAKASAVTKLKALGLTTEELLEAFGLS